MSAPKYKVIISDCHLSAGKIFEGSLNPHEDFYFDDEMVAFVEHFSSGSYGTDSQGNPVEVELFINGDFLDPLNVPYHGEFEDVITETISVYKIDACLKGHPKVCEAFRRFASKPGKKITYMLGNHDADLFFPKVQERIVREWDPEGAYPSQKVQIISDRDRIRWEGGVEVHHGHQYEAVHVMNYEKPILTSNHLPEPVLNIPWGSIYLLKVVNRLKTERAWLDKVRPIRLYVIFGLIFDPLFTWKYCFLSVFYFLKTRFVYSPKRRARLKVTLDIIRQETQLFLDLEKQARDLLNHEPEVKTVIFGHTHKPMNKIWPDGKQYINTGTWTKMINLDWRALGQPFCLTFAMVKIQDGSASCDLRQWQGETGPHRVFHG